MLYLQTVLKENPDSSPAQSLRGITGMRCKVTYNIWFLQVFYAKFHKNFSYLSMRLANLFTIY